MHSTNDVLGAMAVQACGGPPLQDNGEEYLFSALPEEDFVQRLMDRDKDYFGTKSGKGA